MQILHNSEACQRPLCVGWSWLHNEPFPSNSLKQSAQWFYISPSTLPCSLCHVLEITEGQGPNIYIISCSTAEKDSIWQWKRKCCFDFGKRRSIASQSSVPHEWDYLFLCNRMIFMWAQIYGKYTNTCTDLIRGLKKHHFPMTEMITGAIIVIFLFNQSGIFFNS